jgi:hypothetical protein
VYERIWTAVMMTTIITFADIDQLRGFSGSSFESHPTTFDGVSSLVAIPFPFNRGCRSESVSATVDILQGFVRGLAVPADDF